MIITKSRRDFLKASSLFGAGIVAAVAGSCTSPKVSQKFIDRNLIASNKFKKFPRLEISLDRVVKETVGLRPFRKNGFRLEKEMLGSKTLVHNYGHGGSGWSLSWGTAYLASQLVATTRERSIAVMGCGVVGLTTARTLQNQGYDVTVYTKDLPPHVTSSKATGTWSPSSRVIMEDNITPAFEEQWRRAALYSFKTYQNFLGLDDIVTWIDNYSVRESTGTPRSDGRSERLHIDGLLPARQVLAKKEHPFHVDKVVKQTTLVFNIPSYLNKHINDFLDFGGKVKIKEFRTMDDIDALPERCVVNCTGLGSRALFQDDNMLPIAGQLSFLIPQPDFNYRINTEDGYAIPRKDGIILGGNALEGSWDENPSREQTEKVVKSLMTVMDRLRV